jgi:hypothetical protein
MNQHLKDAWKCFGPQPIERKPMVEPPPFVETARPTATRAVVGLVVAGPIGAIASLAFPKHEKKAVR